MRTTLNNINKALEKKLGVENVKIERKGTTVIITGKFIMREIIIEGPAKMTDWTISKWVETAFDVWAGQHGQAVEHHAENVKKVLKLIKRIDKQVDSESAKRFRFYIKIGLRSWSRSAQAYDLRKPCTLHLCRSALGELKSFSKKSHKNQNLAIDMIRRLLYDYSIELKRMKRQSNLVETKKMAKKKVAKKATAATKSVKELLSDLAAADDQATKRKIRSALRRAGHTGGLGKAKAKAKVAKKATKKVAKKKVAKKKVAKKKVAKKTTK